MGGRGSGPNPDPTSSRSVVPTLNKSGDMCTLQPQGMTSHELPFLLRSWAELNMQKALAGPMHIN